MSLTAFVTGASGFVGSTLTKQLHKQGWKVHILARPGASLEPLSHLPLIIHQGDVVDAASVRKAMPGGVSAVFHVAASTSVWSGNNEQQSRTNIEGTRNVLEAAIKNQAGRFIHTSSFTTWGFQDGMINESSKRSSESDWINYVRTKHQAELLVENAVQSGSLDAVILNPAHVLGPGDKNNWSRMIDLVDRRKLPGVPPGSGPFADVSQVAKAHIQAYHKGKSGEKFLLGGTMMSFLEIVRITGELLDRPVPKRATPAWILKAMAKLYSLQSMVTRTEPDLTPESAAMITRRLQCDSGRARHVLDYEFTPVRALLQETIDWMRSTGMLSPCEKR
jgi:nucleoside-diphosphate-sugar epimerase